MRIVSIFFLIIIGHSGLAQKPENQRKLWYLAPASNWNEALPIGNGKLGAMVFGGISSERLQLNEQTIWSGKPNDFVNPLSKDSLPKIRQLLFDGRYKEAEALAKQTMMGQKKVGSSYQMLGDLLLKFHAHDDVQSYRRELDLEQAVATVEYVKDNTTFRREMFCSAPDNILVYHLTASQAGALSFDLSLSRPGNFTSYEIISNGIIVRHKIVPEGVSFSTRIAIKSNMGTITKTTDGLRVEGSSDVTILVAAATNYDGGDPDAATLSRQESAQHKTLRELLDRHVKDYQSFYTTCDLQLDVPRSTLPTNERLDALKRGDADEDLLSLYFQYGRYLLISSSRPGGLPANLQGIWADGLNPPWSADYHININIQMNYWPSEVTNLSALHQPFLQYLKHLNTDGRKTAMDMYGLRGSVAHFTSDAWHFTETYGHPQWAMWPMGLAWSARHLWDHYLYTGDEKFLREEAYPVMRDAALFCSDWLVQDPKTKKLVSGPSISPENTFKTKEGEVSTMVMGPTMDHMIIRDLFQNVTDASIVLKMDSKFRKNIISKLRLLTPTQIADDGRIMEWSSHFDEPEPGHRHISHLYGLHPGNQITSQDTLLITAARKTIDYRLSHGGGHTGWSKAWIINFYARLHDGNESHKHLISLLQKSTLPNLFDNHPPFQIDGNFGATAGIAEMLLQSHGEGVEILPALPEVWPSGQIRGVCARGGFELNISWKNGQLSRVEVLSKLGKPLTLNHRKLKVTQATVPGQRYIFDGDLKIVK